MSIPEVDDRAVDDFETGQVDSPSISYVNEAGVPEDVMSELRENRDIASAIERWSQSLSLSNPLPPSADLFNRQGWHGHRHMFALLDQCATACENDDILSTLADVTEGLAFQKVRFEMSDADQEDIWNQWAREVNLDEVLRVLWREIFKISQVYVGIWWTQKTYTVRTKPSPLEVQKQLALQAGMAIDPLTGKPTANPVDPQTGLPLDPADPKANPTGVGNAAPTPGRGNRKRKKKFSLTVPGGLTVLHYRKVLPIGTLLFGRERFAYVADDGEHAAFQTVMSGQAVDDTVLRMIERKYEPTKGEADLCREMDLNPEQLWLLKEDTVFRHTLTRSHYERWAKPRVASILPLLDMKAHLRGADRASLIGATNFIVVIRKGSDRWPAKAAEIENLKEQSRIIARMPVLVGDHRLSVEIVTPALDNTLIDSRWQTLDARLVHKALMTFTPVTQGGNSAGTGVSEMSRLVARGIENRRHMLARTLQGKLLTLVVDKNEGILDESPTFTFAPKRVALDFNAQIINAVLQLRDRGDLSRETMLEEVDFDQDVEALRRARESAGYDDVFKSGVPFSSPGQNPFTTGSQGGRPPGVAEPNPRKTPDNAPAPGGGASGGK